MTFGEKLVADYRSAAFPRLRPIFEAPNLDEAAGFQGDETGPEDVGDPLPRWSLRPAKFPERRGRTL
ncbi:hypothetical protein DMB66_28285 [Actinoplanes sp. ATCC 53533]|nr:hypothetical protein DMB66_28285 [Actinoplanes sp. ATCC 53533]